MGDLAGSLARDINDIAQDYIANQVDLVGGLAVNLVSGNFEGMADNVIDFSNKQMLAQFNRVMLPVSLGLDVLPAGAVTLSDRCGGLEQHIGANGHTDG